MAWVVEKGRKVAMTTYRAAGALGGRIRYDQAKRPGMGVRALPTWPPEVATPLFALGRPLLALHWRDPDVAERDDPVVALEEQRA
jgi:hypothetical protein